MPDFTTELLNDELVKVRAEKQIYLDNAEALLDLAKSQGRDLTDAEDKEFERLMDQAESFNPRINALEERKAAVFDVRLYYRKQFGI